MSVLCFEFRNVHIINQCGSSCAGVENGLQQCAFNGAVACDLNGCVAIRQSCNVRKSGLQHVLQFWSSSVAGAQGLREIYMDSKSLLGQLAHTQHTPPVEI